jgi:hypothetical protein
MIPEKRASLVSALANFGGGRTIDNNANEALGKLWRSAAYPDPSTVLFIHQLIDRSLTTRLFLLPSSVDVGTTSREYSVYD